MKKKKNILKKVASVLIEKETIEKEEFQDLVRERKKTSKKPKREKEAKKTDTTQKTKKFFTVKAKKVK